MRRVLQLLTLSLFTGYTGIAQDLASKIPEKALAVASIKSDQLFRLFPIGDFDSSALGKQLLSSFSKKTGGDYKSLEDAGINLSATIYYYYQKTDSISYNCLLIPLSDARKFERLFNDTIKQLDGGIKMLTTAGKNLVMWNNEMVYIAHGSVSEYFFKDSLPDTEEVLVDTLATDIAIPEAEEPSDTTDVPMAMPEPQETTDTAYTTDATEATDGTMFDIPAPEEETEYDKAYKLQQAVHDSIAATWMVSYALDILNKNNPSILNNQAYLRSIDKNAIGSFWMDDFQHIYSGYLPYNYLKYANILKGYGSFNARLYLDKEQMRITGEMALDADKADAYRKIYNKKLNKKFLKYINSDSLIGFMSYAFDTESYLNEFPKIFSQSYGAYGEEIELGGDLISLMLDEKAIAKVIKGDALILMTNLTPRESTYTTYVYDENYERKDTVQTKTETLPDVLCMFSSDDTRLIEKLLKYGISKHKIRLTNNVYSLTNSTKFPFSMNVLIKDGIVFMGTSLTDIEQINAGTFKGNLNKQQKELLLNNNMTMFFSPKNLHDKMPVTELGKMGDVLGNMGNVYIKSSGINGNYISGELIVEVPHNQENALKYFFSLFNDFTKAQ